MDKDRFKELCFQYFLNQIQPEDYNELKNALESGDEDLNKIFLDQKKIVLHIPLAAEMVEPSPLVKENIFKQIQMSEVKASSSQVVEEEKKGFFDRVAGYLLLNKPAFALALSVILVIIISLLINNITNLNGTIDNLNNTVESQKTRISLLEDESQKNKELLNVLASKEIEVVIMDGLEINPSGFGKIIWDPDRKIAILQISNLPRISQNKDYQLWVIKDSKPISAGVFKVEESNENFYKIENLAESDKNLINAFAVTLEPKGGVPQPTGEMYLIGKPVL